MTPWSLFAVGLPVPVLALDGCCLDVTACVSVSAAEPDGAPDASVIVARDPERWTQATSMPSFSICLTCAAADQVAHPDAAENVTCAIR